MGQLTSLNLSFLDLNKPNPLSYSAWGAWLGAGAGAGSGAGASGASGGVCLGFWHLGKAVLGGDRCEHLKGRCGPFPHLGSLGAECECECECVCVCV